MGEPIFLNVCISIPNNLWTGTTALWIGLITIYHPSIRYTTNTGIHRSVKMD